MEPDIRERKNDHIRITVEKDVEARMTTLLEEVHIVHNPLPEIDGDEIELSTDFCGKTLRAPLMITAMTGGSEEAKRINAKLAEAAERHGIAIGVGSQRAALEQEALSHTFSIVREKAPNAFVVANIGAPQLALGWGAREAKRAVEMIRADALAIHLNPGQEFFQPEGEPKYAGVLVRIAEIVDELDVPVIVKETGTGLPFETVSALYRLGVKCFDVAGLGGTNWIKVEVLRGQERRVQRPAGQLSDYWGVPTAVSIIEARAAAPASYIVGSGGIRSGVDAAKAIALGADIAGAALPFLRALRKGGEEALDSLIRTMKEQIRAVMFLTGSRRPSDLWRAPIILGPRLEAWLAGRGIDSTHYIEVGRLEPRRVKRWAAASRSS